MKIAKTAEKIILSYALGAMCWMALSMSAAVAVAGDKPLDIGKREYEGACAVCHGISGKGDGPLSASLMNRAPDLTVLAAKNNGVFPFDRVYQIIDGRREVQAHGPRHMPVWGVSLRRQSSVFFENYPEHDIESGARSRMLALTEYLYRIQGK